MRFLSCRVLRTICWSAKATERHSFVKTLQPLQGHYTTLWYSTTQTSQVSGSKLTEYPSEIKRFRLTGGDVDGSGDQAESSSSPPEGGCASLPSLPWQRGSRRSCKAWSSTPSGRPGSWGSLPLLRSWAGSSAGTTLYGVTSEKVFYV